MENRAGHNAQIGIVEIFQVTAILCVAVRAVRLKFRTAGEAVRHEWSGMPQFAPRLDRSRIGQGRRPVLRRIVGESIRREKFPAISGREVQFKDAIPARETVGFVEAKADGVYAWSG